MSRSIVKRSSDAATVLAGVAADAGETIVRVAALDKTLDHLRLDRAPRTPGEGPGGSPPLRATRPHPEANAAAADGQCSQEPPFDALSKQYPIRDCALLALPSIYQFMHSTGMADEEKPLQWIGSSHKDLMALPPGVRRFFGYALSLAQASDQHDAAKVLKGFGGAGVLEVVENDAGGTYRSVYTVKFEKAVFVLHCFQKKSKRGIATPKEDMDIIRARLNVAEALAKELRDEKAGH